MTTVPCPFCAAPLPVLGRVIQPHRASEGGLLGYDECPRTGRGWREAYADSLRAADRLAEVDEDRARKSRARADTIRAHMVAMLETRYPKPPRSPPA